MLRKQRARRSLPHRTLARLGFESLESRQLMAADFGSHLAGSAAADFCGPLPLEQVGSTTTLLPSSTIENSGWGLSNITVTVIDGVLTIRGDEKGSSFSIYGYSRGDEPAHLPTNSPDYIDIGADDTFVIDAWQTTINGKQMTGDDRYYYVRGVTAIDIDLGAGDDYLVVHAIKIPKLTIRGGDGNDEILLKGPVPISTGVGAVWLEQPGLELRGPYSGWGTPAEPLPVDGDLSIDTGAGNDKLRPFADVNGNVTIQMGTGDDSYIEVPYELPQTSFDPVTGYIKPIGRVIGKLQATGQLSIDLGSDQNTENIPDDWRSDPSLADRAQQVSRVLDFYQGMVARGETTPGTSQIITLPSPDPPARIDAEGRLEIEFAFDRGFSRVIERLQARGVTIDAYSLGYGLARAVIRPDDLKRFANLPGLGYMLARSDFRNDIKIKVDPEWDFVRPGSATAAEFPPGVTLPGANEEVEPIHQQPAFAGPKTIAGPVRLEDWIAHKDSEPTSLFEAYYGRKFIGPQPLQ